MSKGNTFENELLEHIFNNADITLIGDAAGLLGSTADGSLYVTLHTADPGEAGDQSTNETAYTGYARQAIARDGTGFTVTGNSVSPQADTDFPECTASPGSDLTHFGIGTASSGAGKLLYSGALSQAIPMVVGTIPRLKSTTAITED